MVPRRTTGNSMESGSIIRSDYNTATHGRTYRRFTIKPEHPKSIEKIIELDFKHFNFFICDYKDIRLITILKEKASERFKDQTAKMLMEIDSQFSDQLANWTGDLGMFENILPPLLDQYFQLYQVYIAYGPDR